MTALAAGPAMAMRNSAFGLGGSSAISATPPNRNSVMPLYFFSGAACAATDTKSANGPLVMNVFEPFST